MDQEEKYIGKSPDAAFFFGWDLFGLGWGGLGVGGGFVGVGGGV